MLTEKSKRERKQSNLDLLPNKLTGPSLADRFPAHTQSALAFPTRRRNGPVLHPCNHLDHQSLSLDCMLLEGTASVCQKRCCRHSCPVQLECTKTSLSTAGTNPTGIPAESDSLTPEHSVQDRPLCTKTALCSAGMFLPRMESDLLRQPSGRSCLHRLASSPRQKWSQSDDCRCQSSRLPDRSNRGR